LEGSQLGGCPSFFIYSIMAKRFTDTEKWRKQFIKSLQTVYKLLWIYILDDCDHAGIWHVEPEIASIRIGEQVNIEEAKKQFNDHIIEFDKGEKWLIKDFINFQYGELNENVKAHKSVIIRLQKYNLIDKNKQFANPLQRVKDKDMDKDKEKNKEKDKDRSRKKEIILPFDSYNFKKYWNYWKEYKAKEFNFKYKSEISEQAALKKLSGLAKTEDQAIKIIMQSIENNWKGFFNLKNNHETSTLKEEIFARMETRYADKDK